MVPLEKMDLCLYGKNNGIPAADLAAMARMEEALVDRIYRVIESTRRAAQYLLAPPVLCGLA